MAWYAGKTLSQYLNKSSSNIKKFSLKTTALKIVCCYLFVTLMIVLIFPQIIYAQEINNLDVKIKSEELVVSASIILNEEFINEIKNGIQKELIFYIDLFRVWKYWPDEYVFGNSIVRKIEGDVIKGEYIMSSFDRNRKVIIEKKFKSLESMLRAMAEIGPLPLINIKGMESGDYYVRVTVESRLRKLPPVVGYILFFIPEKEFSITKDSPVFRLGSR